MSVTSEARQRLIERKRSLGDLESLPDVASARQRLRLAAHNVEAQFSPVYLLQGRLDRHPYLTLTGVVVAGDAVGLLSQRLGPKFVRVMNSDLVPVVSRYALAWWLGRSIR